MKLKDVDLNDLVKCDADQIDEIESVLAKCVMVDDLEYWFDEDIKERSGNGRIIINGYHFFEIDILKTMASEEYKEDLENWLIDETLDEGSLFTIDCVDYYHWDDVLGQLEREQERLKEAV